MLMLHTLLLLFCARVLAKGACGEACSYSARPSGLTGWFELEKRFNCTLLLMNLRS
jgi:hypothetical protein